MCVDSLIMVTVYTVVDVVHELMPLSESSYWLTKIELLQTLGCLDYTALSLYDNKLSENVLKQVIFKLIGDNDYRYIIICLSDSLVIILIPRVRFLKLNYSFS